MALFPAAAPGIQAAAAAESRAMAAAVAAANAEARETALLRVWRGYLAGRPGHVSVAMHDAVSDVTVDLTDSAVAGYETASTVKLAILAALVERAGPAALLPAAERAAAVPMISISDNGAANRMWYSLGGASAMSAFFARLEMTGTNAGAGGRWGLTRTTAQDQLHLLEALAYPNPKLCDAARAVVADLLGGVVAAQRWGLTAGVPPGVVVALKNGWLPYDGGWVVNSIAHVHGRGRDYVMAVYTRDSPSMQTGIDTIEGLSRLAWAAAGASEQKSSGQARHR
jgi:beta-lactamase class A